MTLLPKQEGTPLKTESSGAAAPTSTPVPRPRTLARTETPNATHRPRGRAPHEPTTLLPEQEGTTLNHKSTGAATPISTPVPSPRIHLANEAAAKQSKPDLA
jgi:hypothetical protein